MAESSSGKVKRSSSIRGRFNRALLMFYVISVLISIPATYFLTKQQVLSQADRELTLLVDMIRAARNVVREETRPYFMPKGEFFGPTISSTVMANTIAGKFLREQPDYYIKIASDNPLNLKNLPEPLETQLLSRFRADSELKRIVETGTVKGKLYLVSAAPAKVKKGCMKCHGDPAEAPGEITGPYGTTSGYHYTMGDVVGATVVGVPLADINSLVLKRSIGVVITLSVLFALVLVLVNLLVRRSIINPLTSITAHAYDVSHGNFDAVFDKENLRDDEIGELAISFELMRRSMLLAAKRLKGG